MFTKVRRVLVTAMILAIGISQFGLQAGEQGLSRAQDAKASPPGDDEGRSFEPPLAGVIGGPSSGIQVGTRCPQRPCPPLRPGATITIGEFVDYTDCLLSFLFLDAFQNLELRQRNALYGYFRVGDQALTTLNAVLKEWVVPEIPPEDVAAIEFTINNGFFIEEIEELFLLIPNRLAPGPTVDGAKEEAIESGKKELLALLEGLPDLIPNLTLPELDLGFKKIGPFTLLDFKWLKKFVKDNLEVICEVINLFLKAGKAK